ncbi:MAG: type IV toxin-antitoxin system AbiEi family antitoxin domain-containing protein [Candidatus Thermoplasmatota archaeon]|nr:type IV toxin-antitoxin system AbiEi family antitoxin domain-containing protein [Candidatus Thermoplasmatota archaeon]
MPTRELHLGPQELNLLFTLEKEGRVAFRFSDARRILNSTDDAVKGVLRRLMEKGRIRRLEKGKYLLIPARAGVEGSWSEVPSLLVRHLIDTYYIGFWTTLNYWGMTEQVSRTVFVATTKRKRDIEYGRTTFQFVTLSQKKFFGSTVEEMAGGSFNVSDREKTIIDCLGFPDYAGGLDEVVKGIWEGREDLHFRRLLDYAERYGVNVLIRRLGYIVEVLNLAEDVRERIASMDFTGYMWLDPKGPRERLNYSKDYGLILNRTQDELRAWRAG